MTPTNPDVSDKSLPSLIEDAEQLLKTPATGELHDEIARWQHHGGTFDVGRRAELIDMLLSHLQSQQAAITRLTEEREEILLKDRAKTREINILTKEVRDTLARAEAAEQELARLRSTLATVEQEMRAYVDPDTELVDILRWADTLASLRGKSDA